MISFADGKQQNYTGSFIGNDSFFLTLFLICLSAVFLSNFAK